MGRNDSKEVEKKTENSTSSNTLQRIKATSYSIVITHTDTTTASIQRALRSLPD